MCSRDIDPNRTLPTALAQAVVRTATQRFSPMRCQMNRETTTMMTKQQCCWLFFSSVSLSDVLVSMNGHDDVWENENETTFLKSIKWTLVNDVECQLIIDIDFDSFILSSNVSPPAETTPLRVAPCWRAPPASLAQMCHRSPVRVVVASLRLQSETPGSRESVP
jgi:hypothetical protein